ncbi:MAG TPA: hypothetical protein VIS96_06850 [Terrimicrobiaceae bacterium]
MESRGNDAYLPPTEGEVEISIFGPGYGECILVHLGLGDWIAIDSCIDPATRDPIALSYLNAICIDPETMLRVVLATHWDDDHVSGLAQLFRSASAAKFVCSSIMRSNEFSALVGSWRLSGFLPGGSGVDEFAQIIDELGQRAKDSRYPTPVFASEGKLIWERASSPSAEVRALSPSNAAEVAAIARLSMLMGESDKLRRRIPCIENNHACVVLSIRIAGIYILLGGDLQCRADRAFGWLAVVDGNAGRELHELYKIPHHGSANADHDEVWSKLLRPALPAVTTPYVNGRTRLPSPEDCRRILKRTTRAYVTASPAPAKFRDRDRTVEKTVRETAKCVQLVPGRFGHIRLRKKISSEDEAEWEIALFGDAMHLAQLLPI